MSMEFDHRLTAMQDRRLGVSKLRKSTDPFAFAEAAQRALVTESYQKRANNKATRYALGAMEEVKPEYTAISVEEGTRVGKQLIARLPPHWHVECELQGSVPLNVHIEGVSDVDLLVLRTDYHIPYAASARLNSHHNQGPSAVALIAELRGKAHSELQIAFPRCDVDASGAKSLCMTGGSLRRKVDVVPSLWKLTSLYQAYPLKKYKGVVILDVRAGSTTDNMPFLHIDRIHTKDLITNGGTKKGIRLLKNLKDDSDDKDRITLSSYEIAGLIWSIDDRVMTVQPWAELTLLAVIQNSLQFWRENRSIAMALPTPDGTRKIIDDHSKFFGLQLLSLEVDRLAEAVAEELQPELRQYPTIRTRQRINDALLRSFVPPAV